MVQIGITTVDPLTLDMIRTTISTVNEVLPGSLQNVSVGWRRNASMQSDVLGNFSPSSIVTMTSMVVRVSSG